MQAAHHATQPPLLIGQALNRVECAEHARFKEGKDIQAADQHDPEKIDRQGAQVKKRIAACAEDPGELIFDSSQGTLRNLTECGGQDRYSLLDF
jgi:hypothetical protein